MTATEQIASKLAELSGTDSKDWFVVSRARHGMEEVFRVVANAYGAGEVITQPLTCATAVNPIIASGNVPVYADITLGTLSINPEAMEEVLHSNTRAVVVQHTLGLEANIRGVSQAVVRASSRALVVEDSAHCLGRVSKDSADISVHSFGAEKMLSTSFGGAIWVNPRMADDELRLKLVESLGNLSTMKLSEKLRYQAYPYMNAGLNRLPAGISGTLRAILQGSHVLITPVMPLELRGGNFGTPAQLPTSLARKVLDRLMEFGESVDMRIRAVDCYESSGFPKDMRLHVPQATPLVRYPLLGIDARDAERVFTELRARGYTIGKWYRPLFFPGVEPLTYQYTVGSCPIAEDASQRIINLPTKCGLSEAQEIAREIISTRTK